MALLVSFLSNCITVTTMSKSLTSTVASSVDSAFPLAVQTHYEPSEIILQTSLVHHHTENHWQTVCSFEDFMVFLDLKLNPAEERKDWIFVLDLASNYRVAEFT